VIWWLSLMLLAALFLAFAKKLARLLTRGLENTNVQIDENSLSTLQRVAFSILNAYLIVYAAPALMKMAATVFMNANRSPDEAGYPRVRSLDIIEASVRVVLGLWLLLGSRQLRAAVSKIWVTVKSNFSAE